MTPLFDPPWDAGRDRREGEQAGRGLMWAGLAASVFWFLAAVVAAVVVVIYA